MFKKKKLTQKLTVQAEIGACVMLVAANAAYKREVASNNLLFCTVQLLKRMHSSTLVMNSFKIQQKSSSLIPDIHYQSKIWTPSHSMFFLYSYISLLFFFFLCSKEEKKV